MLSNPAKTKQRKPENVMLQDIKKKKKVPTEFVQLSLDLNENAAPTLYEEKENRIGIKRGRKVSCVVRGCNFETSAIDDLFYHCRVIHQWRDYPCPEENCKFVNCLSAFLC